MLVVDSADVLGSEEDILCANVKGKLGQLEKEEGEGGGGNRGELAGGNRMRREVD